MRKATVVFIFMILSAVPMYTAQRVYVRVFLGLEQQFVLNAKGKYILKTDQKSIQVQGALFIAYHPQGIVLNQKLLKTKSLEITGSPFFAINKQVYRGSLFITNDQKKLALINKVGLEQYLMSVVPSEVYTAWDSDALKAQAVAARTYALYEVNRNKNKAFDVYDDIRSQVYHGVRSEHLNTSKAVLSTKGEVLTYKGRLIKSYYSSSSGGISAAGHEIGDNKPYLRPVKAYPSLQNPNRIWTIEVPLNEVQKLFRMDRIVSISVPARTSSGRIRYVRVEDQKGRVIAVRGDRFRSRLGTSYMKSTLATMYIMPSGNLMIKGKGYGHGVGMGQWEAQELARRGASYSRILSHFYRETELKNIYQ